jgi:hypothetical protein
VAVEAGLGYEDSDGGLGHASEYTGCGIVFCHL